MFLIVYCCRVERLWQVPSGLTLAKIMTRVISSPHVCSRHNVDKQKDSWLQGNTENIRANIPDSNNEINPK